jgi:hypothetical protein
MMELLKPYRKCHCVLCEAFCWMDDFFEVHNILMMSPMFQVQTAKLSFETFCFMDFFEAHTIHDEPNVPGASAKPETIMIDMPASTIQTKTMNIPHHIEYPDWTKFVSSLNHKQYEELKTYYGVAVDASFFAKACLMLI